MPNIEDYIAAHPEAALWEPDPLSPTARVHELGDGVRVAGATDFALLEIDGEVWQLPVMTTSPKAPPPA